MVYKGTCHLEMDDKWGSIRDLMGFYGIIYRILWGFIGMNEGLVKDLQGL